MNLDVITIQDCLDMYEKKGRAAVIEDGGVSSFVEGGKTSRCEGMKERS